MYTDLIFKDLLKINLFLCVGIKVKGTWDFGYTCAF